MRTAIPLFYSSLLASTALLAATQARGQPQPQTPAHQIEYGSVQASGWTPRSPIGAGPAPLSQQQLSYCVEDTNVGTHLKVRLSYQPDTSETGSEILSAADGPNVNNLETLSAEASKTFCGELKVGARFDRASRGALDSVLFNREALGAFSAARIDALQHYPVFFRTPSDFQISQSRFFVEGSERNSEHTRILGLDLSFEDFSDGESPRPTPQWSVRGRVETLSPDLSTGAGLYGSLQPENQTSGVGGYMRWGQNHMYVDWIDDPSQSKLPDRQIRRSTTLTAAHDISETFTVFGRLSYLQGALETVPSSSNFSETDIREDLLASAVGVTLDALRLVSLENPNRSLTVTVEAQHVSSTGSSGSGSPDAEWGAGLFVSYNIRFGFR